MAKELVILEGLQKYKLTNYMVTVFLLIREMQKMSSGVRVVLGHDSWTADKPKHKDCPKRSNSGCSYQWNIPNGAQEHRLTKTPLAPAIFLKEEPVFERFGGKAPWFSGYHYCTTSFNKTWT